MKYLLLFLLSISCGEVDNLKKKALKGVGNKSKDIAKKALRSKLTYCYNTYITDCSDEYCYDDYITCLGE